MPTYRKDLHLGHEVPLVETDDIMNGAITTDKIDDEAVTTDKLADKSVTTEKIADGAVTEDKIADKAITADMLGDGFQVTERMIADDSIHERHIQDDAVTESKILNGSVTTDKIGDQQITENKLADGAVTTDKLADDMIHELETITDAYPTPNSVKPARSGGVYQAIKDAETKVVEKGVSDTTFSLLPNKLYVWGEVSSLNLSFIHIQGSDAMEEYMFQFTCPPEEDGNTATLLRLPDGVRWASDVLEPDFGHTYQVSIVNDLAVYAEWEPVEEEEEP